MPVDVNHYRVQTLVLLTALVAVFGALWLQGKRTQAGWHGNSEAPTVRRRKLLWLAGWVFVLIRLGMLAIGRGEGGWGLAISRASMEMAPLMFLASLAPQYLSRKPRILFVVAFGAPLVLFTLVVSLQPAPERLARSVLTVSALAAIGVAAAWSMRKNLVPVWLSLAIVGLAGAGCIGLMAQQHYWQVLELAHGGILLMTACLFASAFRRLTPGVVFTAGGLAVWASPAVLAAMGMTVTTSSLEGSLNLVRVITAMGMVVLVLEDEIASNAAAQRRDRRARLEMERYTEIHLAPMPFEDGDEELVKVCAAITSASRFRQAAIFVSGADGAYRLAAQSGMEGALEGALDALARRTTELRTEELAQGRQFAGESGSLREMDLTPLMQPGDELQQMNFRKAHVIGIRGRDGRLRGALLLAGLKNPQEPLLTEDVMPLELLVSRIAGAREHQVLLRRLMQSERLAGLGQLAGGVAHELNNPLTIVSGYAELLADSDSPGSRDSASVILNEARRMKQIIESLMRFQKASPEPRALVSIALLLRDIEKLMRPELEAAGVKMHVRVADDLPRLRVDGDQIRQVFLQVTRNAIASLEEGGEFAERRLTVEATQIGAAVQVTFSDTGPGFRDTARAFDPFYTTRHPGEGVGLGLSVCYSIVREHGGEISAVNLHPHGAAVVIELPAEKTAAPNYGYRSLDREHGSTLTRQYRGQG